MLNSLETSLSKATYASTPGWQNQVFDGAGSFNSNGLAGQHADEPGRGRPVAEPVA